MSHKSNSGSAVGPGGECEQPVSRGEIEAIYAECSNWGRWGPDDELGTLNLITPEKVRSALTVPRRGISVSIGRDVAVVASTSNPVVALHIPRPSHKAGEDAVTYTDDLISHNHGPQTHLDPTGHVAHKGRVFPGVDVKRAVDDHGQLVFGSTHARRSGIVTRAVLLDVPRALHLPYVQPDRAITAGNLEAAEALSGLKVAAGDVVMIRTGLNQYRQATGRLSLSPRTGLGPDCLRWMRSKDVAAVCNECPERLPISPSIGPYWHIGGLVYLGLTFIESVDLTELSSIAAQENIYEFLFMVAPLRVVHATGSLVNPIVIY
jgi:kynurenine formamidase